MTVQGSYLGQLVLSPSLAVTLHVMLISHMDQLSVMEVTTEVIKLSWIITMVTVASCLAHSFVDCYAQNSGTYLVGSAVAISSQCQGLYCLSPKVA